VLRARHDRVAKNNVTAQGSGTRLEFRRANDNNKVALVNARRAAITNAERRAPAVMKYFMCY